MKNLIRSVQVVALLVGLATVVNANEQSKLEHLEQRVKAETADYAQKIKEKEGEQLIDVLDKFTGIGSSDRQIFEILEARLEKSFESHLFNKRDKTEARVLSTLIRAYASMGYPESEAWVAKLRDEAKSSGVRNRAHRLVRKIPWFNQRNQVMQKTEYYEPEQELMTHRYLNLVKSETPTLMRWAAEEIKRRRGTEQVVYDAMRIILEKEAHNYTGNVHLDALAWFCSILKLHDLENSRALLESIAKNPKSHKKLVKYASI